MYDALTHSSPPGHKMVTKYLYTARNASTRAHLLWIIAGLEERRRLGGVGHGVELGSLARAVVHLLHFLPAGGRHLSLGGAPFLVSCFPLRSL